MDESARAGIVNVLRGDSRSDSAQRWGALIGGGMLAIYGVSRRSPLGLMLAAGGGALAYLGSTQKRRVRQPAACTTLLVNCSPQEAYRFWRNFENLPLFMTRLDTVTTLDDKRSRWVAIGPLGRQVHWDAEITGERENELIEWRSLPESDVDLDGRVEFRQAPEGRGTLISARLEFRSVPGTSIALAAFLNRWINFALRQDMRRLEALLEAGEIPTTEGQSHGPRGVLAAAARVADPTRPIRPGASLRDAFLAKRGVA